MTLKTQSKFYLFHLSRKGLTGRGLIILLAFSVCLSLTFRLAQASGPFTELSGPDHPVYPLSRAPAVGTIVDIDGDGDFDAFSAANDYYENIGDAQNPVFIDYSPNPLDGITADKNGPAFVDLDGDGDVDLFIAGHYYENIGNRQAPAFVERSGSVNPLASVAENFIKFVDIDEDGDLDLFGHDGQDQFFDRSTRYYENTGSAQSPTFEARTGSANPLNGIPGHTPVFADIDGDNDFDVIIHRQNHLPSYYRNTGDAQNPLFTLSNNPLTEVYYPSLVDIDGDGDLDAFAGDDYYENSGSAQTPDFTLQAWYDNSLGTQRNVTPALVDIDADGDIDAFFAAGLIYYYENTGTAQTPHFIHRPGAANPFDGVNVPGNKPAFVDIDADGDFDAFFGSAEDGGIFTTGRVYFYENIGTPQTPIFVEEAGPANPLTGIEVDWHAAPAFVDIDADGDFDVFIGENDPNWDPIGIDYYENIGTPQTPIFIQQTPPIPHDQSVNSPAFVDIDRDGDFDAFLGTGGVVFYYENIGNAQNFSFVNRGSAGLLNVNVGSGAAPAFADLDADGDFDAFVGGDLLHYYRNEAAKVLRNAVYLPIVLN